ncbi:hypothetical protein [Aquabacter cavernae]|uniref:hypothetical protein n=1 Tax=Aquabacter cavernae TaxID=2496029 RepID=UPI000F8D11B6|nr:hypothetical protein [Aquabacter cavernae]
MSTAPARAAAGAWLDGRYHDDLPAPAERAIRMAGLCWEDDAGAERLLAEAARLAPGHLAVLIARYRHAFYKHRFEEAFVMAVEVLGAAARRLNIPTDWRAVRASDARFACDDAHVRFWMFVLQAYGYVLLRLGREVEGEAALRRLSELDVRDQTRTRVLLQAMAARAVAED